MVGVEGSTVVLPCPILSVPIPFFGWFKDEEEIEYQPRLRVNEYSGTLRIKSARVSDSGQYVCEAVNGFGTLRVNVTLKVVAPNQKPEEDSEVTQRQKGNRVGKPYLINTKSSNALRKSVGEFVTMTCDAKGNPKPQIRWLMNGVPLKLSQLPSGSHSHKGHLHLSNLREESSGRFTCVAFNELGQVNANFDLDVKDDTRNNEPEIMNGFLVNTTVTTGDKMTLICRIKSLEKPKIQWMREISPLEASVYDEKSFGRALGMSDKFFRILTSSTALRVASQIDKDVHEEKLVIERIKESDAGVYVCTALTSKRFNFQTSHVQVTKRPVEKDKRATFSGVIHPSILWIISFLMILLSVILFIIIIYRSSKKDKPPSQTRNQVCSCYNPLKELNHCRVSVTDDYFWNQKRFERWIADASRCSGTTVCQKCYRKHHQKSKDKSKKDLKNLMRTNNIYNPPPGVTSVVANNPSTHNHHSHNPHIHHSHQNRQSSETTPKTNS